MRKFLSDGITVGECIYEGITPEFLVSSISFNVAKETLAKVNSYTKKEKTTTNNFILTVLAMLFFKYSGEEENIITNVVNAEGGFVYKQHKIDIVKNHTFSKTCLNANNCIIDDLTAGYYNIVLDTVSKKLPDIKFNLYLTLSENHQGLLANLYYNSASITESDMIGFSKHFKSILKQVANNPYIELYNIDMLSEEEKKQILVDFNNTKVDYPKNKTVCELFEQQAKVNSNKIALVYKDTKLTYKELNEKANSLAITLRDKGVKANTVVGVMAERSIEMVVAILAITKAGGAYLPIDADYPEERIKYMLSNSEASILLTQQQFLNIVNFNGTIINLNDLSNYSNEYHNLPKVTNSNDLAYIIYTSGTTGLPKGVAVKQYSVVRLIKNTNFIDFKPSDKLLQTCAMTFDVATFEIWGALFSGIELHLTSKDVLLNAKKLGNYLIQNNITIMWLTSPLFNNLCEQSHTIFNGLRCLLIGGDIVSPKYVALVKENAPELTIINGYGPTENTTFSTCYTLTNNFDASCSIPIGTPIANSTAYVLDKHNKLAPIGVFGELCVGGDGLAAGYYNNAGLTAQKFVKNPYLSNELMYRTGDLVRWLPDGNIEFLGRVDHQVKIRGFRIELGEIENQLLKNKAITQVIVLAKENDFGNKFLCAYFVAEAEISPVELRSMLANHLPDYMIPAYFVQLSAIPLNVNGKVNRKSLPEPAADLKTGIAYVAPCNEAEIRLAKIWSEVLEIGKVSVKDNFFTLGGDSLTAMRITTFIHRELSIEVAVSDIFSNPTIKELANYITKISKSVYAPIEPITESELYAVSSAQKRMFALNQLAKKELTYNIPLAYMLKGSINKAKVEECFNLLVQRHEAFRTTFVLNNNEIKQRIHENVKFKLDYYETNRTEFDLNKESANFVKPFDLSVAPLLRAKLIKIADNQHLLMLDMHHIISDGSSMSIIMKELTELYQGNTLPELKVQYKDYAVWEQSLLASDSMSNHEEYWTALFNDDIPVLNLPTDFSRPSIQSFKGENIRFSVSKQISDNLKKACQQNGVTLYMLLLAAYKVLLAKYSGQEDIIVGAAAAGRPHADLQKMVGMFVNTLTLRSFPDGEKSFKQFLQEVKQVSLNGYEHQDYPFDMLVNKLGIKRDSSRNALFDTMFILQNTEIKELKIPNVKIEELKLSAGVSKFDITLEAQDKGNEIIFDLEYCTKLFNQNSIHQFISHYINILSDISLNTDLKISDVNMLSEKEKKQLLIDFNNTTVDYPKHKTIKELFEEQVKLNPNRIALVYKNKQLTYAELNEQANSLAQTLRSKGVTSNSVVGVMAERSIEMIVGILATIKAGGAYLPIDAEYPEDRIKYMLSNSDTNILLTQEQFVSVIDFTGEIINLNDSKNYSDDKQNLSTINDSADLAYIIYTSGTTGLPKGVAVRQYSVVRLIKNTNYIEFNKNDKLLQTCAMTFDVATFEIWGSFFNGIELHLIGKDVLLNANKLGDYINSSQITVMWLTSPLFNNLCEQNSTIFKGIRCLLIGGDVVSPKNVALVQRHDSSITIVNGYGPTENTTFSTCYVLNTQLESGQTVPIGTPIANSTAYILDKYNKLVPIGVHGELCVGGDGLAKGYYNKPKLTAQKFVNNPYVSDELMYRTGDLVKWLPDGNIEFLGRVDHQVKIRGFRIEPGEIENQLIKIKDITQAVVLAKENDFGVKYLCAYIVADKEITVEELRKSLAERVPDYMIPSYFMQLSEMPLTLNGKVNRKALPEPDKDINTGTMYEPASTETEKILVSIWNKILKVDRIGIKDDFFTLGGDSLKAVNIVAAIKKKLKQELSVSEVFTYSTIKQLAEYLSSKQKSSFTAIKTIEKQELYDVSSAQKRMYALNQFSEHETSYNIPLVKILKGKLNKNKIQSCFKTLIQRHEVLRTSFELSNKKIKQRVHDVVEFSLEYSELTESTGKQINAEVQRFIKPFNLAVAPLMRVKLIKLAPSKHALVLDMHHIISDGTSLALVIDEFTKIYNNTELNKIEVQYKDYCAWENNNLNSELIKKQEQYWLNQFSDEVPVLNLPTDFKRPSIQSFEGKTVSFTLNKQLTKALKDLGKNNEATLYMVMLAAYNVLLAKYSGQEDIIVGAASAGRPHVDLQNMIGMFVNTLALRNYPEGHKSFSDLLQEVKLNALGAYENQDYQFNQLVDKLDITRDLGRGALIDTMFVLQNTESKELQLNDIEVQDFNYLANVSKFDITLEAIEKNDSIVCNLEYCTKLYRPETINRFIEHFINIIRITTDNPSVKLCEIDMLTDKEHDQILVNFNNTTVDYPKQSIMKLFEQQVEKSSTKTAVVYKNQSLSYAELNAKANSLARSLQSKGVTDNSIVGIMAERSIELIVGIVAILKAGGAYLPIDTDYPKDRIKYMLEDSEATLLLTKNKHLEQVDFSGDIIDLEDSTNYQANSENLKLISSADSLAYIIYTSGTTGKPKGVAVKQYSVARLIFNTNYVEFYNNDRLLQTCAMTFDVATFEIWGALFSGIELHLTSKDIILNANKLGDYLQNKKITMMWLTSPLFNKLCEDNSSIFKQLRCLLVGGDVVSPKNVSLVQGHSKNITVVNGYGPTENTTFSTCYVMNEKVDPNASIPIGKPISNSTAYVFDKYNKLAPVGVYGELCVGGEGLAKGYYNNDELTNQKFVSNPYLKGEIMYKTGDLVRWLPDGNIEFKGRVDHQVKIRGFRIELGEIENSILKLPRMKEVIVISREQQGNKYLCAYYVSDKTYSYKELRVELKKSLPDYMIPSYFMALDYMPLNQSGKINRKVLPAPTGKIETGVEYQAANTEIEKILVKAWSDVLGIEKIGVNDDFFTLGGDSLKAINIVAVIKRELNIEVTVSETFKHPTISSLATYLNKSQKINYEQITAVAKQDHYLVSSAQKRMYALNQFSQQETNYNIPTVKVIEGELCKAKIEECFTALVSRHEAFRTSFEMINNEIVQQVHNVVDFKIEYAELKLTEQELQSEIINFIKPFNLAKAPLLRAKLIKLRDKKHVLMFDMPHIISDGASMSIIMDEFSKLYNNEQLAELKVQYKDYSAWEQKLLASEAMSSHEQYWITRFSDEIPVLNLPTDYSRPSVQDFSGASLQFKLNKELTKQLKHTCSENGSTMYMALLSAFNILLAKYSGQDDIVVGSPIAGRQDTDLNNMIGMFVNTLAMRNYPDSNKTFIEFLNEVKTNALNAYEHQLYPFDRLVEKLDVNRELSRNAIFDVMFTMQNTDNKEIKFKNTVITDLNFEAGVSKFDISLEAKEQNEEIRFNVDYATKLFKPETMQKMMTHFTNIIKEIVNNQNLTISEIDMITAEEKQQILTDFNNTKTKYNNSQTIVQCFELIAKNNPNNIAVSFEDKQLTYAELNERANQIARLLRNSGVKPDSIVALMVERSVEMMVGIVAILKAGAAYMPISPEYPEDRVQYMLADSKTTVLLTQRQIAKEVEFEGKIIALDKKRNYTEDTSNLELVNTVNDLAYIIYTSGSTGKPKGVMIQHGSVINLVTALNKNIYCNYEGHLNITLIAPYVFDASVKQIFASLLNGHCLCIVPEEYRYMGEQLVEFYIENNIDISDGTPSHFKLILGDNTKKLKDVPVKHFIIGGEELPVAVVKEFVSYFEQKPNITNIYGPTECCVDTTAFLVDYDHLDNVSSIPIGGPLANYQVYVLDKAENLQPIGVAGELCIGGVGVARGYLNRPELSNEKFVDNPFADGKMYKTGDLVKWLSSGEIEFLGRIDHQVKIRGYRIEIGEVDAIIKDFELVQDSVVLAKEDDTGDKKLVAYIVAKDNALEPYSNGKLKKYLKNKLPKYMIPSVFVVIDSMPLNANGKVDRFALPEPDMQQQRSDEDYVAPRNQAETEMAEIWAKTLEIDKIGIDDDFFEIGGDSFKAIKLVRSISSTLGVMQLFKNSTIRDLVAYLSQGVSDEKTMLNELTKPVKDKDRIVSIICFPFGGGSAISYQPLANEMPKNYSLYAVELPGHDFSSPDEDLVSIEESAELCLQEIKEKITGPIVLYGHCLGATMAALLAYKLEEEGIEVDGVFMGAMFPAPRISNWFFDIWEKVFPTQLTTRGNKDLLRTIGGLSSEISAEETDFILRNLKHDSIECIRWYTEHYKDKQKPKFKAPITSVIGDGDRITEFYEERYYEWEHFSDEVDLRTVEYGGHFFFKNQADELADIIEEKVSHWQSDEYIAQKEAAASSEKVVDIKTRKKPVRPSMNLFLTVAIMQIISEVGSFIAFTGCTLWILDQTGALSQFAIMLLFRTVPEILILPFAGAIVDKFSRRAIIILGDIFATFGSMFLLIMMFNNSLEIWHIYVFTVVASLANCFRQPAYWAAITQITPKMFLAQANSVANFSIAIGGIMASLGSGFLMHTIGLKGIILIDLMSFTLAIVVLLFVRFPNTMFNRSEEPILKEILGGCRFILKRKSMIAMVVFFVVMNFFFIMHEATLIPLLESLVSLKSFGIYHSFIGIGALFGAMVMLFTGGMRKRAKGMVMFVIPIAISMIIGALRPSPVLIAISFFGIFASLNILDIHWRSLIQVKVGLELQGRVFAVNRMMVSIFIPFSYIVASYLSDNVFVKLINSKVLNSPIVNLILAPGAGRPIRLTLMLAGVLLLLWSLLGVCYKPLMEMDDILEDASVGNIAIKDKDKLQEMIDKKQKEKLKKASMK